MSGSAPRYLLPLGFCLIAIVSSEITRVLAFSKKFIKILALSIVFFIGIMTVSEYIVMFQEEYPVSDMGIPSKGKDLKEVIDFLKKNDCKYVYTNCSIQARIMFESKGEIIASSDRFIPMVYSHPEEESAVRNANGFAYIVYTDDPILKLVITRLSKFNVGYQSTVVGSFTVIHNLSRNIRPSELLKYLP
jgi:hypothetical protein